MITTNILQFLHNTIRHHQWLQSKRYDIYFCQYLKLMNLIAIDYYFHTQYLLILSSPQTRDQNVIIMFSFAPVAAAWNYQKKILCLFKDFCLETQNTESRERRVVWFLVSPSTSGVLAV